MSEETILFVVSCCPERLGRNWQKFSKILVRDYVRRDEIRIRELSNKKQDF
jgi:hypothetical protein